MSQKWKNWAIFFSLAAGILLLTGYRSPLYGKSSGRQGVTLPTYDPLPPKLEETAAPVNFRLPRSSLPALEPAGGFVVEGFVTDSVLGWPLYAQITVSGFSGSPIWTDPVTGYYSATVSSGSHTFDAAAFTNGYLPASETQTVNSGMQIDFELDADLGICTAPGYALSPAGAFTDGFESGLGNWIAGGLWNLESETDSCGSQAAPFPGPSNAAYFGDDADCDYDVGVASGELTLAAPLSIGPGSQLTFWSFEETEDFSAFDRRVVEISTDGGSQWITVTELMTETLWYMSTLDLSPYAPGDALLRFRFDSVDSDFNDFLGWMLDDISVSPLFTCQPPASGGLVVGNVYDENTGAGLAGATITNQDGHSATAQNTPGDPLVDDGFFTIYSPAGTRTHTATQVGGYAPDVESVTVGNGGATRNDFHLPAAFLSASPDPLEINLGQGFSTTISLNISNPGGVAASFQIREQMGGSVNANFQNLPAYTPPRIVAAQPAGQAYTNSNLPTTLTYGSLPAAPPRFAGGAGLVFYGDRSAFDMDNPGLPVEDFENTLIPDGNSVSCPGTFDSTTNNACFSPGGILDGIAMAGDPSDTMVVLGDGALGFPSALVGPGLFADDQDLRFDPVVYAVGLDLFSPLAVDTFDIFIFGAGDVLIGQTAVVADASGTFFGVLSETPITRIRTQAAGGSGELFDDIAFGGNPPEIPWLSLNPESGTLPSGGSAAVESTFWATSGLITETGLYTGLLFVENDTLYGDLVIPVTMNVLSPAAGVDLGEDALTAGNPGSTVTTTLLVTNTGNIPDTFDLSLGSSAWPATLSTQSVVLNPGAAATFEIWVAIPAGTPEGQNDSVTVTVRSQFNPAVSQNVKITTTSRFAYIIRFPFVTHGP